MQRNDWPGTIMCESVATTAAWTVVPFSRWKPPSRCRQSCNRISTDQFSSHLQHLKFRISLPIASSHITLTFDIVRFIKSFFCAHLKWVENTNKWLLGWGRGSWELVDKSLSGQVTEAGWNILAQILSFSCLISFQKVFIKIQKVFVSNSTSVEE